MAADFNLRKPPPARRPPPAAGGFTPRAVPGLGPVPLRPGEVLVASETQDLAPLGWQPGDPVPPEFADELARARAAATADSASGQFNGVAAPPLLRVPPAVPIESLPADRQAALRQMLANYRDAVANAPPPAADVPASVAQAIRAAGNEAAPPAGFSVFDSRKAAASPAVPPAPGGVPPPDPAAPAGAAPAAIKDCPHCGWDLALPPAAEPTPGDKANFLIAILGGQPFVKEYPLFGGRLVVALRQLRADGSDMVRRQLAVDQRDGRVLNLNDLLQIGADYRAALTLRTIRSDGGGLYAGGTTDVARAVDDLLADPAGPAAGDGTPLPSLVRRLKEQPALAAASVWNAIAGCAERFNALVATLENRADSPDFWAAAGG